MSHSARLHSLNSIDFSRFQSLAKIAEKSGFFACSLCNTGWVKMPLRSVKLRKPYSVSYGDGKLSTLTGSGRCKKFARSLCKLCYKKSKGHYEVKKGDFTGKNA
jgi:hypothetical protein